MEYAFSLEDRLKVRSKIDLLENYFDEVYSVNNAGPHRILREIKLFLYKRWSKCKELFKGSSLYSDDCLSITTIASMLATRKGIETAIASPRRFYRFLHSMLVYNDKGEEKVFEIASRVRDNYSYQRLSVDEVQKRLSYLRFLFPIYNALTRNSNHTRLLE